ncbi:hypothetical protein ACH4Y0_07740 [Streptomyces sp. NPDC020707]|uniref:Uncharacterized protein n=1 Tax=Streptomyces ortus TaxID=2867268 RepID=A0ABT3V1P9_9ACTN|nr:MULTISPECIES: hypothetical protein [Streptomyces]MCX4233703.1 hypothetical protein [Streptomyces ortus]
MTRTQKFLTTLTLILGAAAALASPAAADNSMPAPAPNGAAPVATSHHPAAVNSPDGTAS